jgi:hypothetical protein
MILCCNCETRPIENHDTGLCASCAAMFRKAERQAIKDASKVKKPIRKVSKKRAIETRWYLEKKAKYMEIFPICQAKGCGKPSTDLHHRQGRQGSKLTDDTLFMALCFDHHEYYTEHSAEAIEDGISLLRSVSEPHKI